MPESKRFKAKKNLATKFARSSPGEAIILKYLGPEGTLVFKLLIKSLTDIFGKKAPKSSRKTL